MDFENYSGPAATAPWNIYDARAGKFTEATEYDYEGYDSDESVAARPLEANLSRYLHPGLTVRALSASVAYAPDDLNLDPEAPGILGTGLEEFASLIDVLSRPSFSVFTSALFDLILAEARNGGMVFSVAGLSCASCRSSTMPLPCSRVLSTDVRHR